MNRRTMAATVITVWMLGAAPLCSQGQASCGFHLDVRANLTSTHSAVSDLIGSFTVFPAGAPSSPFSAYATPGSPIAMVVSGNPLGWGPAPLGAGSCLTMFYAIGSPLVQVGLGAPFIGPCISGTFTIGVLPGLLTLFDTCGFTGPAPPIGFFDPGGGRFTITAFYPVGVPPLITLQAAGVTPGGSVWLTNAVSIIAGPNPAEVPVPPPIACGGGAALDDGQSLGIPTMPGFLFYGVPTPFIDIDTNGFVDMLPGVGPCNFIPQFGDFGCPAPPGSVPRPRIDVNHTDLDFTVLPAPPFVPAMTTEIRAGLPFLPDALIIRWKNVAHFGTAPGVAGLATNDFCLELWSFPFPGGGVNSLFVIGRSWIIDHGQVGFGPGVAGQGYGGPPPVGPPSTCALGNLGLPLMGTYAFPVNPGYSTFGLDVVHMNSAMGSADLFNSAIVVADLGFNVFTGVF